MLIPIQSHTYPIPPRKQDDVWAFQRENYWCEPVSGGAVEGGITLTWEDETGQPIQLVVQVGSAAFLPDESVQRALRQAEFRRLVDQWKKERGSRSSIPQSAYLDSYQKIMGMGPNAVPLIIDQLKSEGDRPDQWFWALRAITKQNPVKPEDRGNFPKMAQAWIEWWESQYAW